MVLTGAAGMVGGAVRERLRRAADKLVLVDRVPMTAEPGEEAVRTDLSDPREVLEIVEGADAIVHLAGVPDEAPLPDLLDGNVLTTHRVLEAARLAGVRRVALASSNRLTGMYPATATLSPDLPPRPDGLYGVSKVALEALGRLYADKFGLEVVCLRIGSLEPRPVDARHLATWLSPRDCAGFFHAAVTTPGLRFLAAYAVSANTRRFWKLSPELGYEPLDDAESHEVTGDPAGFFTDDTPQGGPFATPEYTLRRGGLD
ncbi:MAG: NAD(P)-dependent oxidoreductase [Nonomuraea sp.]|nr:NAD(P)-dependent oxidoreductase [Nonomuraea sp.]NUP63274.1 NAD(P)-dependent oxidoreductase [Nonomuraea sp.]NUP82669.1 NAD(P)-dependent oxidoreductase [Nonomuraea sp.]